MKQNFFIIGAPKCGTTSLAAWLAEHPNIFIPPVKEPFFFSTDIRQGYIHTWNAYLHLFDEADSVHGAVGEASTSYLFSRAAVPAIEKEFPAARYIVMLRNPVDMAYAFHDQLLRNCHENVKDFRKAWLLASERRAGRQVPRWCENSILLDYPAWCQLGAQLERLYTTVPRERVLVLVFDDMKEEPREEYVRTLEFLRVSDDGRREFPVYNPARELRWRSIGKALYMIYEGVSWAKYVSGILPRRGIGLVRLIQRLSERRRVRPVLPPDLRAELIDYFDTDISRLEQLLGREFPTWRCSVDS